MLGESCVSGGDDQGYMMDSSHLLTKNALTNRVQLSDEIIHYIDNENLWNDVIRVALVFDETVNIERISVNLKVVIDDKDNEIAFLNGKSMTEQDKHWLNNNIMDEREKSIEANQVLRKIINEMNE